MPVDDESARWVAELSAGDAETQRRLHELLVRIARAELSRRSSQLGVSGPEADDLCHQAAADAMVIILAKLGEFRFESRFTTWAYKFVMFEVSAKVGRHFWRRPPVPLTGDEWDRLPERFGFGPAQESEANDLLGALRHAVEHELTAHQREIFVALILEAIPLDALVVRLGSNRNAIYKTLFDARRKVRAALAAKGYLDGGES
jgi:RNA polymerase sigma-70 factor (ECF subfamily)